MRKIASLSRGSQRWLKTALASLYSLDDAIQEELEEPQRGAAKPRREPPEAETEARRPAASLEDVVTGKADLREHLEAYPELENELEGLADIIDMLREAGKARRRRGEQILREEILGEEPAEEPEADEEP